MENDGSFFFYRIIDNNTTYAIFARWTYHFFRNLIFILILFSRKILYVNLVNFPRLFKTIFIFNKKIFI